MASPHTFSPGELLLSISATFSRELPKASAAVHPEGPAPHMTTSKSFLIVEIFIRITQNLLLNFQYELHRMLIL
jgi:hypothetical protein